MNYTIVDIEGDSLNPTKIHCLSWFNGSTIQSTTDYDRMRQVLLESVYIIGHNIILWDIPNIERLLEIKISAKLIDSLALSWYLYPNRVKHGLESWGFTLGFKKPEIIDWENQSIEDYIFRCECDVEINKRLWEDRILPYLNQLYSTQEEMLKLIEYLSFKLTCVALQEKFKWKLDVKNCEKHFKELSLKKEPLVTGLSEVLHPVVVEATIKKPKKPFKANGEKSVRTLQWEQIESTAEIINYSEDTITYIKGYKPPNPNSSIQVKDWLFSLGWKPITFDYKVNKETKKKKEVPQIKVDGELCESVIVLIKNHPEVALLEELTLLSHRINILKGFLRDEKQGYLKASIAGFTNTLRFRHKELVNLPGVRKPYGDYIRGVLIAEKNHELCGSDMASLEDRTKQHYMWEYDPTYVKEMQVEGFDPHLALAEFAGALTPEQVQAHKDKREDHEVVRYLYKRGNYACIYGVGSFKLSKTLNITKEEAEFIIEAYWRRNWSVKKVAEAQRVKTINNQMWLLNPVSKLWYSLRYEKDIFSTLNQGTGTYAFDMWVKYIIEERPQLTGQFHDEVIIHLKKGNRDRCRDLLNRSIKKTNEKLKLNRNLDIDIQFGDSYAKIH